MLISDIISTTFVALNSDEPADDLVGLLQNTRATHLIISCGRPETHFYLLSHKEVLYRLASQGEDDPGRGTFNSCVSGVLRLEGLALVPVLDINDQISAATVPDRFVATEDGRLLGFFDIASSAPDITYRGPRASDHEAASSVPTVLDARFPAKVALGEISSLLAGLSSRLTDASHLHLDIEANSIVEIVVVTHRGLELLNGCELRLKVLGSNEALPSRLRVRATQLGPSAIELFAFHKGECLGRLMLRTEVVPEQPRDETLIRRTRPIEVSGGTDPDLTLVILDQTIHGRPSFSMRLTARDPRLGLYLTPFGPVELRAAAAEYFSQLYNEIESLARSQRLDDAEMSLILERYGDLLFEQLIPKELGQLLWKLRRRIASVRVDSEEVWIPWELIRLHGEEGERILAGPYLCEWQLTRWMPGIGRKLHLTSRRVGVVMPEDSGLPEAELERAAISTLYAPRGTVDNIPATFVALQSRFSAGDHDVWHFIGHGHFEPGREESSSILLENARPLRSSHICGTARNLGRAAPLVFLNACRAGRGHGSLTGVGGFARRFLEAGAGAFIGASWNISDRAARTFAERFHRGILQGETVAVAIQGARSAIRSPRNPTWLAYTVFADPSARLIRGDDILETAQ